MLGLGLGVPKHDLRGAGGAFSDKSLLLDGVDEYVNANSVTASLVGDTVGTLSIWIRPQTNAPTTNQVFISFGDNSANTYIALQIKSSGLGCAMVNAGSIRWNVENSANVITSNEWQHIAIVQDGVEPQMYVNGTPIAQTFITSTAKGEWFSVFATLDRATLGARQRNATTDLYYNGFLDESLIFNTALSDADILDLYNTGCPKNESATANVVSYWRMGDGNGDNWNVDNPNEWTFADQVGANDSITVNCEESDVVGNTACNPAYSNSSLYLDGTNEYVNADSLVASLSATTQGTWSAWIKAPDASPTSNKDIITFGDTSASYYLRFTFIGSTNKLTFGFANVTEQWRLDLDDDLLDNVWYHIAIVQNGVTPVMYVNGVAVGQAFVTSIDTTQWFNNVSAQIDNGRIGCLNFNSGGNVNFFNGNIDEITIWNVAKSASDVLDIYNGGCPKDESGGTGLVSYYRMGDGTGDNWNTDVVNEWDFVDQEGANDIFTANCEQFDVVDEAPCTIRYTAKSLYLDGTTEIVNTDAVLTPLASTTAGTWSGWFKPTDATPTATQRLITFGDTSAVEFIHLSLLSTGELNARVAIGGVSQWNLTTDTAVFVQGDWHHIVIVMDGVEAVFFIDGVEYSTTAGNATMSISVDITAWFSACTNLDNGRIGALNQNGAGDANHFDGNVTNVLFINRALTEAQVQDIWNGGCPKDESEIANGVSLYRMGNSTDDNFNDAVAGEWQFVDQIGTNNAQTVNCELDSVETVSPC